MFVQLLGTGSCSTNLMRLLVTTLCAPSSVGFNVGDVRVMDHLPDVCVGLLKALKPSPYCDALETLLRAEVPARRWALVLGVGGEAPSTWLHCPVLSPEMSRRHSPALTRFSSVALRAGRWVSIGHWTYQFLVFCDIRRMALTWLSFCLLRGQH